MAQHTSPSRTAAHLRDGKCHRLSCFGHALRHHRHERAGTTRVQAPRCAFLVEGTPDAQSMHTRMSCAPSQQELVRNVRQTPKSPHTSHGAVPCKSEIAAT